MTKWVTLGSPRNDFLIGSNDQKKVQMKLHLGIPLDKKVLLFAPTFRESVYESGIHQFEKLDFLKLSEVLTKQFNGEWCFVFRVHHEVMKEINAYGYRSKYEKNLIIDGNLHDDMAEYLLTADVLLTDYSSCMFDFALTKRPVFLLTLDKERYCNDERGLYMSMDQLPFPYAMEPEELYRNIAEYDSELSKYKIELFLDKIGNREDGKSSERIVRELLKFMSK